MNVREAGSRRLVIASVIAAVMLIASVAYAATGGFAPGARRLPTIVSDRPLEVTPTGAAALAPTPGSLATTSSAATSAATATPSAVTQPAPSVAGVSGVAPKTSSRTPRTVVKPPPVTKNTSSHRDDELSREHEVVNPYIRDDEPDDDFDDKSHD